MTMLLALLIVGIVAGFAVTVGPRAARRAERYIGAWAWIIYVGLGLGMLFGALSVSDTLLSAFMWTKLTAFIITGGWLLYGRVRRREAWLPRTGARQPIRG